MHLIFLFFVQELDSNIYISLTVSVNKNAYQYYLFSLCIPCLIRLPDLIRQDENELVVIVTMNLRLTIDRKGPDRVDVARLDLPGHPVRTDRIMKDTVR